MRRGATHSSDASALFRGPRAGRGPALGSVLDVPDVRRSKDLHRLVGLPFAAIGVVAHNSIGRIDPARPLRFSHWLLQLPQPPAASSRGLPCMALSGVSRFEVAPALLLQLHDADDAGFHNRRLWN